MGMRDALEARRFIEKRLYFRFAGLRKITIKFTNAIKQPGNIEANHLTLASRRPASVRLWKYISQAKRYFAKVSMLFVRLIAPRAKIAPTETTHAIRQLFFFDLAHFVNCKVCYY